MSRRKALVAREPNGRAKRTSPLPPASEVSRLRDAALAGMRDPVWGTTLGYLYLSGKVTGSQFAAGKRWADLARDYSAASQSPKQPRSANLDPKGGEPPDPDSEQGRREARQHAHTLHQYIAGLGIINLAGAPARRAVEAVCEQGQVPAGHTQLEALGRGLSALAAFWSEGRRK